MKISGRVWSFSFEVSRGDMKTCYFSPGWYSQSLQLLHVIKSPALDHGNLILHQLPAERGLKETFRKKNYAIWSLGH